MHNGVWGCAEILPSSLWLEVRTLKTFGFLDRRRISPEKINMYAAILNNTKGRNPLFQTQNVDKRLIF